MSAPRPSPRALRTLAELVDNGLLPWPPTVEATRSVGLPQSSAAADILLSLISAGSPRSGATLALRHLATAYESATRTPVLVTSGPRPGAGTRDTAVVMEELFGNFERELLVVGFAVHQGGQVFTTLAKRHDACPDLRVVMCLNISRQDGETSVPEAIIAQFAKRLRTEQWPGKRMPIVYFDPRGLADDYQARASLHAKCIVADRSVALITSANFTLAAQEKNIEVGALVDDEVFSSGVAMHFEQLISSGTLQRLLS
jgi:phosphatidylserine/phosphatidylglycerophosphate/cardiolipin synthase-like enzyme